MKFWRVEPVKEMVVVEVQGSYESGTTWNDRVAVDSMFLRRDGNILAQTSAGMTVIIPTTDQMRRAQTVGARQLPVVGRSTSDAPALENVEDKACIS